MKKKRKKKKYADPEMGYCPLSIRQLGARARGAQVGARGEAECAGGHAGRRRGAGRAQQAAGVRQKRGRGAVGAWAQAVGARGAWRAGGWGARRHGRATGSRWAQQGSRPGRAAGPVGCALGALSLFLARLDSILFLSRFLDIVREPGS